MGINIELYKKCMKCKFLKVTPCIILGEARKSSTCSCGFYYVIGETKCNKFEENIKP